MNFYIHYKLFLISLLFCFSAFCAVEFSSKMSPFQVRELANELLAKSRSIEYGNLKKTTIDLQTNKPTSRHYRKRYPDGTLRERIEYLRPNGELLHIVITNDAGTFEIIGDSVMKDECAPCIYMTPPELPKKFYAKKIDANTIDVNGTFVVKRSESGEEAFAIASSWTADDYKPPEAPLDPNISFKISETVYDGIPCVLVRVEEKVTPERIAAARKAARENGGSSGKITSGALPAITEYYLRRDDYFVVALISVNSKGKIITKVRYVDIELNIELPDHLFDYPKGKQLRVARDFVQKFMLESEMHLKLLPTRTASVENESSINFFSGMKRRFMNVGWYLNNWFWDYGHFITLAIGIICLSIAIYGKIKYRSKVIPSKKLR